MLELGEAPDFPHVSIAPAPMMKSSTVLDAVEWFGCSAPDMDARHYAADTCFHARVVIALDPRPA